MEQTVRLHLKYTCEGKEHSLIYAVGQPITMYLHYGIQQRRKRPCAKYLMNFRCRYLNATTDSVSALNEAYTALRPAAAKQAANSKRHQHVNSRRPLLDSVYSRELLALQQL